MGDNQPGFKAAQTKVNFIAEMHRFENCTQFVSLKSIANIYLICTINMTFQCNIEVFVFDNKKRAILRMFCAHTKEIRTLV